MAARASLNQLIDRLRSLTQVSSSDWQLGTATFWDSDHMQQVLDDHRFDFHRVPLAAVPKHTGGGSVQYLEYYAPYQYLETTSGGTAVFVIEDSAGADKGTATWSADYMRGKVTFTSDQKGTAYYATGRTYDLNGAAADIWRMKADHYSTTLFDFSTDNMSVKRGQVIDNSLRQADRYAAKAWAQSGQMLRGDEV
jgi:hypothetical protein